MRTKISSGRRRLTIADWRLRSAKAASGVANGVGAVTAKSTGRSVQAFASHWGQVSASHLGRLTQVYELTADAQDVMANVVEGAKAAVIAHLIALAGEIAAAAAGSVMTFGLSDAAGLAATALTRITVREILDELERQLIVVAEQLLAGEVLQALSASIGNLLSQGVADYVGTGHGVQMARNKATRTSELPPGLFILSSCSARSRPSHSYMQGRARRAAPGSGFSLPGSRRRAQGAVPGGPGAGQVVGEVQAHVMVTARAAMTESRAQAVSAPDADGRTSGSWRTRA